MNRPRRKTGSSFNRRGDSLGSNSWMLLNDLLMLFQSQGRFFGGATGAMRFRYRKPSIRGFNRRGDSLGGATTLDEHLNAV